MQTRKHYCKRGKHSVLYRRPLSAPRPAKVSEWNKFWDRSTSKANEVANCSWFFMNCFYSICKILLWEKISKGLPWSTSQNFFHPGIFQFSRSGSVPILGYSSTSPVYPCTLSWVNEEQHPGCWKHPLQAASGEVDGGEECFMILHKTTPLEWRHGAPQTGQEKAHPAWAAVNIPPHIAASWRGSHWAEERVPLGVGRPDSSRGRSHSDQLSSNSTEAKLWRGHLISDPIK